MLAMNKNNSIIASPSPRLNINEISSNETDQPNSFAQTERHQLITLLQLPVVSNEAFWSELLWILEILWIYRQHTYLRYYNRSLLDQHPFNLHVFGRSMEQILTYNIGTSLDFLKQWSFDLYWSTYHDGSICVWKLAFIGNTNHPIRTNHSAQLLLHSDLGILVFD